MASKSGALHVATIVRRVEGTKYTTHLLRRTYREGGRVKHETLGNVTHLPAPVLDLVRRSLKGETFVPASEAIQIQRSLPHGHVEAILGTIRALKLDTLLAWRESRERSLVVAMIAERLICPCSKLATTRAWATTTLAEEMGVADATTDELYAALDWLVKRKTAIEKKLAGRHLSEGAIALYDVSSSYYEGHTCPLAHFGYGRDGKRGLPIIVYGVMTDREGRPVGVDVYKGNTGDPTTVPDAVERLRTRFGLERVVLVGDRGLLVETRIETLRQYPGIGWISALRSQAIRALVAGRALTPTTVNAQRTLAEITSPDYPGERLVACFNPLLARERSRKREELLEATEAELEKVRKEAARRTKTPLSLDEIASKAGRIVNRHKMGKHFDLTMEAGRFAFARKADAIQQEADLDGIYIVRTSEPASRLSAPDVVRTYKGLAEVERAFRNLKAVDLLIRPIHHRTEDHVRGHILLCLLAYYLQWHMKRLLAPLLYVDEAIEAERATRDPVAPARASETARRKKALQRRDDGLPLHSFKTLMMELGTRCRNTCILGSDPTATPFHQLTQMTPLQAEAFRLLGL
jgi:transposase